MLTVLGGGTRPQPRPKRSYGGYTILELMIVLSVSVIVLVSAAAAIGGSNAKTQFAQSMRDVNSKMQDWINDVTDGFAGATPSQYTCTLNASSRPQINPTNNGTGSTSPNCIFLGKAVQLTTQGGCSGCASNQPSKIYIYSVFGRRTMDASGALSDNMYDANPVPAVGSANASAAAGSSDLTETYTLMSGAEVKSITSSAGSSPVSSSQLVGFYSSFNSRGSTANGAQDLKAYAYRITDNAIPGNQSGGRTITDCLELATATCYPGGSDPDNWPEGINYWKVCFASGGDNETAQLTITSNGGLGVQTKMDFISC